MTTIDETASTMAPPLVLDSARGRGPRPERGAAHAVGELLQRHGLLCASAVDTWEVAAGLEAQGMSDRDCLAYGYSDVFALAEALFQLVPRDDGDHATESSRPVLRPWRSLLRGLIYALPAVVGLGAVNDRSVPSVVVLIVALAVGWGWSQAMSFLGHRNLGWKGELAARGVMRTGLISGLVVVALVVFGVAYFLGSSWGTAASGTGIGIYMVAAGVLLVFGDELVLLAVLLPGSAAGIMLLLDIEPWWWPEHGILAGISVLAVVALAARVTGVKGSRLTRPGVSQSRPSLLPDRDDLLSALPHLVYGVTAAVAVGLGPSTIALLRGGVPTAAWYVTLPVVLSMGAAELQLERLMHRTHLDLRMVTSPATFARLSRRALGTATSQYLAVVVLLSVLAIIGGSGGRPHAEQVVLVVGYAALAACFFVALTLVAIGRVIVAGGCMVAALTTYLVLVLTSPLTSALAYAVTFGAGFLVLLANAVIRLRNPLVHL